MEEGSSLSCSGLLPHPITHPVRLQSRPFPFWTYHIAFSLLSEVYKPHQFLLAGWTVADEHDRIQSMYSWDDDEKEDRN
jgi:hypothetical protein